MKIENMQVPIGYLAVNSEAEKAEHSLKNVWVLTFSELSLFYKVIQCVNLNFVFVQ